MSGPCARDPQPGEPEHRQRWRDAALGADGYVAALAYFRERPDQVDAIRSDARAAQEHAAALVRAALAGDRPGSVGVEALDALAGDVWHAIRCGDNDDDSLAHVYRRLRELLPDVMRGRPVEDALAGRPAADVGQDAESAVAVAWFRDAHGTPEARDLVGYFARHHAASIVRAALAEARPAPQPANPDPHDGQRQPEAHPPAAVVGPNSRGGHLLRGAQPAHAAARSNEDLLQWLHEESIENADHERAAMAARALDAIADTAALRAAGNALTSRVRTMFAAERPTLWHRHRGDVEAAVEAWQSAAQPSAEQDGDPR